MDDKFGKTLLTLQVEKKKSMSGRFAYRLLSAALLLLTLGVSCRKEEFRTGDMDDQRRSSTAGRVTEPIHRRVMLLYSAGYNSLSGYLRDDIEDLSNGDFVPGNKVGDNILLVFSRFPVHGGNYTTPTAPALFRLYKNSRGEVVRDTLSVPGIGTETLASSPETLNGVLSFVKNTYPGSTYGMVFSSHGTGWLPEGYFTSPEKFDGGSDDIWTVQKRSLGQDLVGTTSHEMSLKDVRDAIPMRLNYLILDACLMGGVEVAWELREVVDTIAFTQTETLAYGFDYEKMARRLLVPGEEGVLGATQDFFIQYDSKTGQDRSATVSLLDLRQMDPLAEVCARLFEKYRDVIATMNHNPVQRYFRFNKHWFYDLEDILLHAGITAEEQAELTAALDKCIIYKAATPYFLSIPIDHFSGLSMFLPSNGSDFLKTWYRENISWNDATALVK